MSDSPPLCGTSCWKCSGGVSGLTFASLLPRTEGNRICKVTDGNLIRGEYKENVFILHVNLLAEVNSYARSDCSKLLGLL